MNVIGDSIVGVIETLMHFYSKGMHKNMEDYCDLETADDKHTLVMQDGSLVSIIKLDGAKRLVGDEEYRRIVNKMTSSLSSYLGSKGHALQFYFERDPDAAKREIDYMMSGSVDTAKRLRLNALDVIEDKKNALAKWCSREVSYISLITTPAALSKDAIKRSAETQKESYKKLKAPAIDAQNPIVAIGELRDRHSSFVSSFIGDMEDVGNGTGLSMRLVDVHEACRAIRMTIDPEYTDEKWMAYLPGDPLPTRISRRDKKGQDISDLLWPRLSLQLFPRDIKQEDDFMTIGDRTYASMYVDVPSRDVKPFSVLFARTREYKMPWRVSFLIESGGIESMAIKNTIASILAFSNNDNRLICDALDDLKKRVQKKGEVDAKVKISFATWGPSDNLKLVKKRSQQLARAVEGWGQCNVQEISGDPVASFISSCLNVSRGSVATPSALGLEEVVSQLPVTRPSSPWETGTILFRSPDGKILPYTPGSSKQDTWIDLIFAGPGSGKSVLLNNTNFALCLSPSIMRLPRIFIIDIGPSSKGLVSLLKEALPEGQKHLAMYERIRMKPEYSINPFDTQLGSRFPMPMERAFLVNFLTLLATPIGKTDPYDGIADMAGLVVNELYKMCSDKESPKPYAPNIDFEVDKIIQECNIKVDRKTTWWEIVDALFDAGKTHEAYLAQRYAVPMLSDAVAASSSEPIRQMFGKISTPSGESLVDAFNRMISGAVREYPILSQPTKFDIGEARVVSLDLDEVAKTGGDAADRQTGVMYMLARYLARDFYLNKENLGDMSEKYRPYHKKRIEEIAEDIKRICFDEFHRTKNSKAVRDQVVVDMREGRKWQIHVVLLSQSIDDFDENMTEFATNVFFLSAGNQHSVDKMCEMFGLNSTDRFALENRVHGPREGGPTFLAFFKTKNGKNMQLMTNTAGSIEMWAFSTTKEDTIIRDKLYGHLGPAKARAVLAKVFPSGSAKSEIDRRIAMIKEDGGSVDGKELSMTESIVKEVLEAAKEMNLS